MPEPYVLIVEDERAIALLLAQIVSGLGVKVETAHNGQEAWAKLQAAPPALMLLDLIMPIMSGEELLARMELEGLLERVPVLVISTKETVEGLEHLCLPTLMKPFEPGEVKCKVRQALGLSPAS